MIHVKTIRILAVSLVSITLVWTATAQDNTSAAQKNATVAKAAARAEAQSESRVSAEMVKGKLNPATSKPGDEVAVRLKEDAKANGQVLVKKGSTVKGVVKKVHRAENKSNAKGSSAAQSMIELEWMTAGLSGTASQSLNLALQSVIYTNPLHAHQQESSEVFAAPAPAAASSRSSGGLGIGGAVGGVVGGATSSVGAVGSTSVGAVTQTQAGLGRAPSILPASTETSANLQNNLGISGAGLFHVGSGQSISAGGTPTSMDIFSHMSNDAVITSPNRDFEIASGAQMQFFVQSTK